MNTTGELPNPGPVTVTGSASTATPTRAVAAYALARVLGRHYDGIEYRGSHQSLVEELARHAKVPVWNGLTDEAHLTQILADLMTKQDFGEQPLHELSFCYLGDASSNMGSSLQVGGTQMGMDVRICAPAALQPPPELVAQMRELARATGARIALETDPLKDAAGADFLCTDVRVSTGGGDAVWNQRIDQLLPYQVTADLMRATGKVTPRALAGYDFAAGSTGLKAVAARAFVVAAGQRAVIGSLDRIEDMLSGRAGTQVCTEAADGAGVP